MEKCLFRQKNTIIYVSRLLYKKRNHANFYQIADCARCLMGTCRQNITYKVTVRTIITIATRSESVSSISCNQQRLRSACASPHSDQKLRCSLTRPAKAKISLRIIAVWSEPSLLAHTIYGLLEAVSKGSYQPTHPRTLIRAFAASSHRVRTLKNTQGENEGAR